ncbi:MAG: major capsid protein [Bacillota bacterium]
MAINIFDTRTMLQAVEQIPPVRTFIRDTFFTNIREFDTAKVDVDLVKGNRRIAAYVNRNLPGKPVDRQGYSTSTYTPPKVEPMRTTTAEQLMKRLPGETPYAALSPQQRAMQQLTKDLIDNDTEITRREEVMCAQALFNGKINIVGDGVNDVMDFGLTNFEDVLVKWDAPAALPYDDIQKWQLRVQMLTGVTPNMLILATDAAKAFINSAQIQKIVSTFRDLRIELAPQSRPNGTTFVTRIVELGIDIYAYNEWYYDDTTKTTLPIVPQGMALLASSGANFHMLYGACAATINDELVILGAKRLPRSWTENNPPVRFVATASAPLPVPVMIDSIFSAQVVKKLTAKEMAAFQESFNPSAK